MKRLVRGNEVKTGILYDGIRTQGGMLTTCRNGHDIVAPWIIPIPINLHNIGKVFANKEDCVKCPECGDVVDLLPPLAI